MKFENILHLLNYRWNLEAHALWKGDRVPFETYKIYEGYENFITLDTLAQLDQIDAPATRNRLKHALIDHYLQRVLLPHENEMRTWMKGAAAVVDGEKIYFRDTIPWCQKSSTYAKRQILQKETLSICRFLKPFVLNYWNILLDVLKKDLGFRNYLDYCCQKKEIAYRHYYKLVKNLLAETDAIYFPAMERWSRQRFAKPLCALTRFDAINILGLGQFDSLFPDRTMEDLSTFFNCWEIDLKNTPGLNLELGKEEGKSAQAICFVLQVPEEVYILMQPEGGWIDLETLWHELGHGLSAVFTSPELSIIDRDMATSFSLSESFAFLLQNITLSQPFLREFLGLKSADADELFYYKVLKDLSIFRRYAAKFLVEFEMFEREDLSNGEPYAALMTQYTGFNYQADTHLFDLVPEFYSLDYLLGWLAEAKLENFLREHLGRRWIFHPETPKILKRWWAQGNQNDLHAFLDKNALGSLTPDLLLKRWKDHL
jgi:hypothetical protein